MAWTLIAEQSQCGKKTFTRQLLWQANGIFERPIKKTFYCCGLWQECIKDMTGHGQFVERIPEDIPWLSPPASCWGVLVLDDLMRHCSDDEHILDLFT